MKEINTNDTPIGTERAGQLLDNMSHFEIARWQALMDSIEIIYEKCIERKMKFSELNIKPLDISKYIESTCDIYARNIERQRAQEAEIKINRASNILPHLINEIKDMEIINQ